MKSRADSVPAWKYAFLLLFMCLVTVSTLWLTDLVLVGLVKTYQPVKSYWLAAVMFLLAATTLLLLAFKLSWKKRINYLLAAVAVFFPLVVLTEIIRLSLHSTASMTQLLSPELCGFDTHAISLCSEAFSNAVFIMSLRALTTIVIVPPMFYFLLIKLER